MLITRGEKPNQFFNAQPVPNAISKVIWRKIVGDSVQFAKVGGTKPGIAGKGLTLTKRQKLKQLMKRDWLRNSKRKEEINSKEKCQKSTSSW